jgi:phenylpropionate dioxygenase-like ring-hydroxylating dioxygenase large terminal subunit
MDRIEERIGGEQRPVGIDGSKAPEPVLSTRPLLPSRYFDRGFWQREWDRMWTRTWQLAGLKSQVQKPGDYIMLEFGREVIFCVMGEDAKIRAFYNVCQHRGMKLLSEEQGRLERPRITCPYHGWVFDTKGTLRTVPDVPDFAQGNPCGKRNLVEIPCESWGGFIWFNMDPDCAPLRQFLSPVADHLDAYPMEEMKRTVWVTIEGDWNWKLVQDNFNESYHVPFLHPHLKFILEYSYRYSQFDLYQGGHCRMIMPGQAPSQLVQGGEDETLSALEEPMKFWELNPEDFRGRTRDIRAAIAAQKRKLGGAKGYDFSSYDERMLTDYFHYTVFPNLSMSMRADGNIFTRVRPHPTDPEKCFFDMWYMNLFPKGVDKYWSYSIREWLDVNTDVPHQIGKAGEVFVGPTTEGDVLAWPNVQKALHSRGYLGDYLSGQERRVRYFHDVLDTYLEG